ncbi:hypothetical protein [Helicobacter pylori]|uniref:hypothetical protein n=1 Tax=Helicobacter pylori TaxID=210 RepID=UPI000EB199B0|nr:hypothetical protein [Helicobacter pylori]
MDEKIIKIIPEIVFLFCLLEIFELGLTIGCIGTIEKLEVKITNNLKASENIAILLDEHLKGMDLKHFKDKNIKIK